ncbi:MAG: hypothetical protein CO170_01315 [candidate division SR1 bacterium CG_4_9_14_3_um_filter_40_9]|nr:MAG: hypothetical protein CO170_01315 [candidate division SR1 bacterium CG_4_9_14_3_um_filter_40_9]
MEKEKRHTENKKKYLETIKKLEIELFSEFKNGDDIHTPEGNSYFYFAPSRHVNTRLITKTDINDLISDDSKTLLSIGSGSAFLERLLVKLGVKKENITLSDIDPKHLPKEFKSKIFDMYGSWTDLGDEKYDLIIFPESVLINRISGANYQGRRIEFLYHLILQALQHLKSNGKIKMSIQSENLNINKIKQRLRKRSYKLRIALRNNLLEVKDEATV